MVSAKLISGLVLATVACLVVFYISDDNVPSAETVLAAWDETEMVQSEATEVPSVIGAIGELKSYCILARERLHNSDDAKGLNNKKGGAIALIDVFGKINKDRDLVTDFAQSIAYLEQGKYSTGIGEYMIDQINTHVLLGKSPLTVLASGDNKGFKVLDHNALGLKYKPHYLKLLAVSPVKMSEVHVGLHSGKGDAAVAIRLWHKSQLANSFHRFYAKLSAQYMVKYEKEQMALQAGAKTAMQASFKESEKDQVSKQALLHPLPPAGKKGALEILENSKFHMLSKDHIKKEAMAQAKAYMKKVARDNNSPGKIALKIERHLEGVTIKMGTSKRMFAESTQSPHVKIVGTKHTVEGKIEVLPVLGGTFTQTFPSPRGGIGEVKRIILTHDKKNVNPWLCNLFQVQVGHGNAWVTFLPQGEKSLATFWLDGADGKAGPYYRLARQSKWLLKADGDVTPVFHKKYSGKTPTCPELACEYETRSTTQAKCLKNTRCDGYSYTAGRDDHGQGCMLYRCHKDNQDTDTDTEARFESGFDYYEKAGYSYKQEIAEKSHEKKLKAKVVHARKHATTKEGKMKQQTKNTEKGRKKAVGTNEKKAKKYYSDEKADKSRFSKDSAERQGKYLKPYWDVETHQGRCTAAPCNEEHGGGHMDAGATSGKSHCLAGGNKVETKVGCKRPGTLFPGCSFKCQRHGLPPPQYKPIPAALDFKMFVHYTKTAYPTCPDMKCGTPTQTISNKVMCTQVVDGSTVSDRHCEQEKLKKPKVDSISCSYPKCVKWVTTSPTGTCPSKCGQSQKTLHGTRYCSDGGKVPDKYCSDDKRAPSGKAPKAPAVPTKVCPATKPCGISCTHTSRKSNQAGVITPSVPSGGDGPSGYQLTGGGMNNHYRSFDKLSAFEEMYPTTDNKFNCDTGFGPGHLTCYAFYCQRHDGKPLHCVTRKAKRFQASGVSDASLPSGYVMTGGGIYNHYRHFNTKAQFEESRPNGNMWRGDMGNGWGDYTTYVRGCQGLSCKTVTSKRGNNEKASCPSGYHVTGCGINNHNRNWGKLGAFEEARPEGQGCRCDAGFGSGDMTCYARCCKADSNWRPPPPYKYQVPPLKVTCSTRCGQKEEKHISKPVCIKASDGSQAPDKECESRGLSKPKGETKTCPATGPCPVNDYCECKVTAYAKSNYARRRRSKSFNTRTMGRPKNGEWHWSSMSYHMSSIGSIKMSTGCKQIIVEDDDEEEVLLTTSASKWRQDQTYSKSIPSLPYDLEDDVKGIRIYPKFGCLKHCTTSNFAKCP